MSDACEVKNLGGDLLSFYELLSAPASKILNRWFDSEPLKATLSTDSVIGAMMSPFSPGSGYSKCFSVDYISFKIVLYITTLFCKLFTNYEGLCR